MRFTAISLNGAGLEIGSLCSGPAVGICFKKSDYNQIAEMAQKPSQAFCAPEYRFPVLSPSRAIMSVVDMGSFEKHGMTKGTPILLLQQQPLILPFTNSILIDSMIFMIPRPPGPCLVSTASRTMASRIAGRRKFDAAATVPSLND